MKMSKSGNHRRAGFTLVEVLVVVLIASIVMAVLASVLASSFEVLRTGETRAQLNSNARIALNYICDDISTGSGIPLSFDRDLNGYPDEHFNFGYDELANWRVAEWDADDLPVLSSSFWISEAWGDRVYVSHKSEVVVDGQNVVNRSFAVPRVLRTRPTRQVSEYMSLLRLAIPASNDMPYYLASEWDRTGDGIVDAYNTGTGNPDVVGDGAGEIDGYPEVVAVGPYKETAVLIQDLVGYDDDPEESVIRVRQIPVASNITRMKLEYLHQVPVYYSRWSGSDIEIAYQSLDTGEISWIEASYERNSSMEDHVPIVSHYEQRVIDVTANATYTDPEGNVDYYGTNWRLQDQYPEGLSVDKLDGTHTTPNSLGLENWSMSILYNDNDGDRIADTAPPDRYAYVTTSYSGTSVIEGGIAGLRPDMEALHGSGYYDYSTDPIGEGIDFGDADGIPDGDGVPDDPVPGWWLPYLRAVRVTVVATPNQIIEQRRAQSGSRGSNGNPVYYRLDSPVPYQDANRTIPLPNLRKDYIGAGRDVILSRIVPVEYVYRTELITDPADIQPDGLRRVEYNYFRGRSVMFNDPMDPSAALDPASNPITRLYEKDPL
jgi:prepilin-type N-terminal cleavage/methylation domain-containing protein